MHSAAPCPIDVKERMLDWWGPTIYEYYAATEGGGTLATPEEWLKKPGTVGKAWPMSEIRVLDDDGQPVPAGEAGTVWIKMGDYTFEYNKDKAKTEESWKEGFFTVGDIGYLDEDGYLFLCDRKADMIISGGVNIYPAEVEAALVSHPKVDDVAVIGIPDEHGASRSRRRATGHGERDRARSGTGVDRLLSRAHRPLQVSRGRSTSSPSSRATRTASCTSARFEIRTGRDARARSRSR